MILREQSSKDLASIIIRMVSFLTHTTLGRQLVYPADSSIMIRGLMEFGIIIIPPWMMTTATSPVVVDKVDLFCEYNAL